MEGNRDFPTAVSPAPAPPPWLELPPEIMSMILQKLGAEEILTSAELVCTTWRRLCLEPSMWRVIDMKRDGPNSDIMCRRAVDRSQGQLIDINIEHFVSGNLLNYVARRSPQLKRLRLVCFFHYCVSGKGLSEAVEEFPLLEELHLCCTPIPKEVIKTIGQSCPLLKSFKLNCRAISCPYINNDDEAIAIAQNMPELRHLQLIGSELTNVGLEAIRNGCPHLESLDLNATMS